MKFFRAPLLFLFLVAALHGADLRVATLNCFLFFRPDLDHPGKIDEQKPMTPMQYSQKVVNLATLVKGFDVVGLQETGGRAEIQDLATAVGAQWAYAKGKDTYTGQEVGLLYRLPEWRVAVDGRVGALDSTVSKHLLVTAKKQARVLKILVVHLIRPIGKNEEKQRRQLSVIADWARLQADTPNVSVLILGDTNNSDSLTGTSVFGIGSEAGEALGFPATHLNGKCYDRLVLVGAGKWLDAAVTRPPYGRRPNDDLTRVWTDHFLLGARFRE